MITVERDRFGADPQWDAPLFDNLTWDEMCSLHAALHRCIGSCVAVTGRQPAESVQWLDIAQDALAVAIEVTDILTVRVQS